MSALGTSALGAAVLAAAIAGEAAAHGGLSMEDDLCKLAVGGYNMHFTGYQPDATAEREFCEDIPVTGRTIIVLDFLDEKLRDLPVEMRIIRDTGDESNLDAVSVFHKPPAVHANGSFSVEHLFPERGRFVGLVTVQAETPLVSRFPFAVGTGGARQWLTFGAMAIGAVAIGGALFYYSSRHA